MRSKYEEDKFNNSQILDSIFYTTNALIAYLDTDFNFIRVNKKYAEAGNHPPEFYIGKNHFNIYPDPDNQNIFRYALETCRHITCHAKPFQYEEFPERGITYWDWDLIPITDKEGHVNGLILSIVDVTQRKLAEDKLRQSNVLLEKRVLERTKELQQEIAERIKTEKQLMLSKKRYQQIFENTSDGVLLLDIIEEKKFSIIAINPSMAKILGLKSFKSAGRHIGEVLPKDFSNIFHENCINCLYSGDFEKFETSIQFQSSKTYIDITLIPIHDDTGRVYRILGICSDITHHKKIAENLRLEREAAERENQAINEYIANMSHELRTPLNVIMSALQLFHAYVNTNPDTIPQRYKNHLDSMNKNSLRLLRLINNLIDSTKIDSGFFELELRNYDIVNVIKTITLSVTDYMLNKNIKLDFTSNVDKKIIACDIDVIERIMLNLLSNAIKFTEEFGTIKVSLIDQNNSVLIVVKDNGIGIAEDQQKIIFERYKRGNQLFTRKYEGSGIGLALTKSLVEALDGSISVNSQLGYGSEFIIELPCKLTSQNETCIKKEYTNEYNIIQKISVELSDLYNIS